MSTPEQQVAEAMWEFFEGSVPLHLVEGAAAAIVAAVNSGECEPIVQEVPTLEDQIHAIIRLSLDAFYAAGGVTVTGSSVEGGKFIVEGLGYPGDSDG